MYNFFSKNWQILPIEEAKIDVENVHYQYGFGVYENIKVRNQILYFVKMHIDRLLQWAKVIELEHNFSIEFIEKNNQDLIKKLNSDSFNIKILLLGGNTADDAQLYILPLSPLFIDRKLYRDGVNLISTKYERWIPNVKSLNMLPSYLIYKKAKKQWCYDGLLLDSDSNILEWTRTNFFLVKWKTLFTAPKEKVLEWVTKTTVIQCAKENWYEIEERLIKKSDLNNFDWAFVTSTSSNILPVKKIDDFEYEKIDEKIKNLMKEYDKWLKKNN